MQKSELFTIKYDGKTNEIDADTFIYTLNNFNELLKEVNQQINSITSKDTEIKVKIKSFSPGSFDVNIDIISSLGKTLLSIFSKDNVEYSAALMAIVGGLFSYRQFLKGKPPKATKELSDNKVEVTNDEDKTATVDSVFVVLTTADRGQKINEYTGNIFAYMAKDENITSFNILDKNKKSLFKAPSTEFETIGGNVHFDDKTHRYITKQATINIFKIVMEVKHRWSFIYDGNRISALMIDESFFGLIDNGLRFGKGDALFVDLKIKQEFDKSVNTFVNKEYEILKVLKHIPRGEQQKLDL